MLEGKCPKCSVIYHGWALCDLQNQTCPKCGTSLEITEDGHKIIAANPHIAKGHPNNTSPNVHYSPGKWKGKRGQKTHHSP